MCFKKLNCGIALAFLLVAALFSCKKLDKDHPIAFIIKAHIPYNDEPISGVKYIIREYKVKAGDPIFGSLNYTDFKLEGFTDSNGNASISFTPKKSKKYGYDISFDYSAIHFASYSGSYSLINAPTYQPLVRNDQQNYKIRVLPITKAHFKIENINCFDSNDKMRYKVYNYDEFPYQSFQYINSWSNYFEGCAVFADAINNNVLSGHLVYQIEVTRNNQIVTYIDTVFLQPGVMNEVFLEY